MQRQKHWDGVVRSAMRRVRLGVSDRQPQIVQDKFFGATGVDPVHLSVWYIFAKDVDQRLAESNGLAEALRSETKIKLQAGGYPAEVLPRIFISFTSIEDIQNTAGGDQHEYFQ